MLRRLAVVAAASCLAAYVGALVLLFVFQRDLVFPGKDRPASPLKPAFPIVTFVADGETCVAMDVPGPTDESPVVVWFHGNGGVVEDDVSMLRALSRAGFRAIELEYPGYAGAPGDPSEASITACAKGLSERLAGRHVSVIGHSLGSGPAMVWAVSWPLERLVLLAPYTSLVEMGSRTAPWAPVSWLMRDRFMSLDRAPSVRVPALVFHGTSDEVIPFEMGRRLSAAIPGARFRAVGGGDHNPHGAVFPELVAFLRGGSDRPAPP